MGDSAYALTGATTSNLVTGNDWSTCTYTINIGSGAVATKAWEPETDLAWLDRRVDELRVKL